MKIVSAIISVVIILVAILILLYSATILHAQEDPFAPMRGAKEISAYGSESSGISGYGYAKVITQNDKCYEYLFEDKGDFVKYRKCGTNEWIPISNNKEVQNE